jgi:ankyrin repeat protein
MSSQTKITPAISAKAPTEPVTTTPISFYTHKLPATDLLNKYFNKSADLSKQSIQDNPYDQRTDQSKCPHQRSENWNSNHCADCHIPNIGGTRVADEKRFAETAKMEDHQYLVDQLKPILGSMQVTRATKPGEDADMLGTGTLLELRESNTMALVAFGCTPTCRTILEREKYEYVEQDQKCHVVIPCLELKEFKNCHARRIHNLGITSEALIAFGYKHDCWNWPTYKVMRDIILPATRETRCRYADLPELKSCFGPATVFMSHCWGAKFGDLIGAACHGARKDRVVWIDIFAVRQWPGNVADLDFRGVISRCDALVVSTSPVNGLKELYHGLSKERIVAFLATDEGQAAKKATPFFRLWCIVELVAAILLKVPIVVKGGSVTNEAFAYAERKSVARKYKCKSWTKNNDGTYNVVFGSGRTRTRDNVPTTEIIVKEADGIYEYDTECIGSLMGNLQYMIDVDASECAVITDYKREMKVVHQLPGGSKGVNALVAGIVLGGALSIRENVLEVDAFVCNEPESFRALDIPLCCEGEARNLAWKVLAAACAGGRESIVQELLSKWNVKEDDDQNKEGETKRNDSMKKEKEKERKWLIQLIDDSGVLWGASNGGHVGVVEKILEVVDINVNLLALSGMTPLYIASQNGHLAIVKALIEAGGNVNQAETEDGCSPLYIASQNGNVAAVKVLIKAGGNVNQHNQQNVTPIIIASLQGHTEVVRLLLQQPNIDLNKIAAGKSALGHATNNKIIQLLKDAVAKINKHNDEKVQQLISMGFDSTSAKKALALHGNNVESACNYLLNSAMNNENSETKEINQPFIRTNKDQKELQTDKKCANGHGLIRFNTPSAYFCDLCSQSIPTDTVMYGCNECNYDICIRCEENTLGERKQDDDKEEEEEEEDDDEDDDMDLAMALSMSMNHDTTTTTSPILSSTECKGETKKTNETKEEEKEGKKRKEDCCHICKNKLEDTTHGITQYDFNYCSTECRDQHKKTPEWSNARQSIDTISSEWSGNTALQRAKVLQSYNKEKDASSSTTSSTKFYCDTFTRPPSISLDLFKDSSEAMEEGISRNPFAHHNSSNPNPKHKCKCEVSRHKFAFCADCKQKSIPLSQIALEEEWSKKVQQEDASHQDQHMAMVHACGVTIEWLLAFSFDHNCWHRPTWWVNRHIIKEATRHNRRRYMDLDEMKQHKRPATIFMSHCWGALWGDVVLAACHGARHGRVVWIDLFAVRQWPGNKADLDFRNVINKCQAFIVSVSPVDGLKESEVGKFQSSIDAYLDSEEGKAAKKRIPVFRLWCNVEIAAACKKIPIVIKGGRATKEDDNKTYSYDTKCVGKLMSNLQYMIDVEASECEVLEDYEREINVVRKLPGGSEGVNALVAGVVLGGFHSIDNNILEIDAFVCKEPESFRALNIPLGCEGEAKYLARSVLTAACGGGRDSIVQELLLKWNVKEDDDQNKEGETKRNDSMKKEKEKERKWLIQLIDDTKVLWTASSGGHVGVVEKILEVVGINVNVDDPNEGGTSLFQASSNGHVAIVKALIKAGGNVNQARRTGGFSPLYIASEKGNVAIVKVLTEAGGNVNQAETTHGQSPLYIASNDGNVALVKALIKAGGNVDQATTTGGDSPLCIASQNGNVDLVKVLIEAGGNVNQAKTEDGCSPLYIASEKGNVDLVEVLIKAGGNVNQATTTDGVSPLCIASQNGNVDLVKVLIKAGGNVNQATTDTGTSPLWIASQIGNVDTVKVLIKAGGNVNQAKTTNGTSPLYIASQNGNIDLVKVFIEAGGNVNQHSNQDATPLLIASCAGHTETVRLLLRQPNIDIHKTAQGYSAIGMATQCNHPEIIQLLKDVGANIDIHKNPDVLHRASFNGREKVVKVLLTAKGVNVNQADTDGCAPLYSASQEGHNKVVKLLLAVKDINVNQPQTTSGCTPLIIASQNGNTETVALLLGAPGIQINQHSNQDATPLFFASINGHIDIVRLLLQQPNIDVHKNPDGDSAIGMAYDKGHTEIVELLKNATINIHNEEVQQLISMGFDSTSAKRALALHGNNVESACNYLLNSTMNNESSETKETNPFIRTNEDQKELQTDKKCANGHGLIGFNTPHTFFSCSVCKQVVPADTVMYGCNKCNYDICVSCEENTLGERKQDDDKEEEEEEEEEDEDEDEDDDMDLAMALSMSMNKETETETKPTPTSSSTEYKSETQEHSTSSSASTFTTDSSTSDPSTSSSSSSTEFIGETKERNTSASTTSSISSISSTKFYRDTFTRPTSIPLKTFANSSKAMKDDIESNPYAHWVPSDSNPRPKCKHSVSRHKFAFCADCKLKVIPFKQIAEEEQWSNKIQQEDVSNTDHMSLLHGCGVTIEWLLAFTFDHNCWDRPTWWVNRHIIKEATRTNRKRYMELDEMKQYARPATVFMSHCWGATWGDVVLAACHGARFGRVVWIDLFAVRQWPGNGADLDFRNVINKCQAFIVSVSPVDGLKEFMGSSEDRDTYLASDEGIAAKKRIPTFRLWCNVEIAAAYKKIPIVIKGGKATKEDNNITYSYDTKCIGDLMENLSYMIDVEASECAVITDYEREMKVVRNLEGGSKGVNALVAGVVGGAIDSIQYNILEIDAFVCDEPESFRALNIPLGCEGETRRLAGQVLIAACGGGRDSIVQELLSKWNVKEDDDQNKEGETKRNGSLKKEKEKNRKWLIQLIDYSLVLVNASNGGHVGVVEKILEVVGINVNVDGGDGCTPLYIASANGHLAILKVLIKAGGNVNQARTTDGLSPLYIASQKGHVALVKVLIDAGGNVNQADTTTGCSPLWQASQNGNVAIVKVLIEAGGDVNQHANNKATPIIIASLGGHPNVVRLLLQQPNINLNKIAAGKSALGHATNNEIIQLLKDAGAKRNQEVEWLISMGFDSTSAKKALALHGNNVKNAFNYLLNST